MWEALGGAAIGAIGNIIGGSMQQQGQAAANAQNAKLAREQMAFQERMSSTAYQRAMQDMRAAGLNPILAYSKGGASSPGGSMPNMTNEMAGWGPAIANATSSAQGAFKTAGDYAVAREEAKKKEQEIDLTKAAIDKAKQETATSAASMKLALDQAENVRQGTQNAAIQNQTFGHQVNSAAAQARIDERRARDMEGWGDSTIGRLGATTERVLRRAAQWGRDNVLTPRSPTAKQQEYEFKFPWPGRAHPGGGKWE